MSSYAQEIEGLIALAERQGWKYQLANNGHHKFIPPGNGHIVQASSTPSDVNAIHQVERDLIKAGLKIPNAEEEHMRKRRVRGVREYVVEILMKRGRDPFYASDIEPIVKIKFPDISSSAVSATLSKLAVQDKVIRLGRGHYRWKGEVIHPPAPTLSASAPMPKASELPPTDDEDVEILNKALVALSEIERIVRKYREISRMKAALKEALK